jgi:hypothetical protein
MLRRDVGLDPEPELPWPVLRVEGEGEAGEEGEPVGAVEREDRTDAGGEVLNEESFAPLYEKKDGWSSSYESSFCPRLDEGETGEAVDLGCPRLALVRADPEPEPDPEVEAEAAGDVEDEAETETCVRVADVTVAVRE